jgi:hypothetical protein
MKKYSVKIIEEPEIYKRDILNLWERNIFNEKVSEERFDWLYNDNPAGKSIVCLAFENSTGNVIGCGTIYQRDIIISGMILSMGIGIDFAVDEKHRVLGPAVSIQRNLVSESKKSGLDLVFVYPNKISSAAFKRAGYEFIGASNDYHKLLKHGDKIQKIIKVPYVSGIISVVVDNVCSLLDLRLKITYSKDLITESLDIADSRFDKLWESKKIDYRVVEDRCSKYLQWRFLGKKGAKNQFYCLFDAEKKTLLSFITYSLNKEKQEAIIKDVFPVVDNRYLSCFLSEFARTMKRDGMKFISISYFGNRSIVKMLRKLLYFRTKVKRDYYIYMDENINREIKDTICDNNNFYFFYG